MSSLPELSTGDFASAEGNSGATNYLFTLSLSSVPTQDVTVLFATADGTATAAEDYQATSGTLTFVAGQQQRMVTVAVTGDTKVEADETFFLNLSSPVNATISDGQGAGTIRNDDPPALSIDDVSAPEGQSGISQFVFTVSLSAPSTQTVTVNFSTVDNTAVLSNGDYQATAGTLTFTPGLKQRSVTVAVVGDSIVEADETFFLNLSSPGNATIGRIQGVGTIENDDSAELGINDVAIPEGQLGTTTLLFTVSLSAPSSQQVTVAFATADGTATTADSDYEATSGTLTFTPGLMEQTITVAVNGDTKVEADETFFLNLSGAMGASIVRSQGTGTIGNDDGYSRIIAAGADAGGLPTLRVFNAETREEVLSRAAYDSPFTGGVRVAVADLDLKQARFRTLRKSSG